MSDPATNVASDKQDAGGDDVDVAGDLIALVGILTARSERQNEALRLLLSSLKAQAEALRNLLERVKVLEAKP